MPTHALLVFHPCPLLQCSQCKRTVAKVLGTKDEWVSLGARPDKWWEKACIDEEDARFWHDAAMAGMMAGYIPSWRPKSIRTLKAPQFKSQPCLVQGCKFRGCTGNITMWKDKAQTVLGFRQVLPACLAACLLPVLAASLPVPVHCARVCIITLNVPACLPAQ